MTWVGKFLALAVTAYAFGYGIGFASKPQKIADTAEPACGPSKEVAEMLTTKYGEKIKLVAVDDFDNDVHFYTSGSGVTWSIVRVQDGGMSCVVIAGKALRAPSKKDASRLH